MPIVFLVVFLDIVGFSIIIPIFLITQMHGIGWSTARRWWAFTVFMGALLLSLRGSFGAAVLEASLVPLIYWLAVPLLAWVIRLVSRSETGS